MQSKKLWMLLWCLGQLAIGQQGMAPLQAPVDIPIGLSGTFGEIRASNIHAGVDIRTQGRQGLPISSAWGGYVSRISVSTGGYGKAVYVTHPNGLMSVYAHLRRFSPKLEAYIKKWQYEKESYTLQRFPKKGDLPITQGELLGYSGNTGNSFGPHLHFELRDAATQEPVNPMRYGIKVADKQRPQLVRLMVFQKHANDSLGVVQLKRPTKVNDSLYTLPLFKTGGAIGFGLQLFDRQDRSWNKNGVYQIRLFVNGVEQYHYCSDRMSYTDSRHVSQLYDYPTYANQRIKIQKLFPPLHQEFSFVSKTKTGFVTIEAGNAYQVKIEVEDFEGNRSFLETYITGTAATAHTPTPPKNQKLLCPDRDYLFDFEGSTVYFPKGAFYRPHYISINGSKDTLFIDRDRLPMKKALEIQIPVNTNDTLVQRQTFIAKHNAKGAPSYIGTRIKEGHWFAKTKGLGQFVIARDSVAPEILPANFKPQQWLSNYRYLKVKIKDDLSGIKRYRATINGQWARFEYEPKTQTLTYDFRDQEFALAPHELQLTVEDNCGNTAVYETTIFRKYGK